MEIDNELTSFTTLTPNILIYDIICSSHVKNINKSDFWGKEHLLLKMKINKSISVPRLIDYY